MMHRTFFLMLAIALSLISLPLRAQFNYRSFSSIDDITFNGSAKKLEDRIRLVPAAYFQGGSVWFNTKQRVADGFESTFTFQVSEPGSNPPWVPGADGMAFVLQNSSVYEGSLGGGIGYGDIANSLAVEFDTYDNNPDNNPEPNGNHISVQSRGLEPNSPDQSASLGWTTDIADMKDGNRHTARVRYIPGRLEVYFDDLSRPVITIPIRLDTLLHLDDGKCWMGFTAATGGSWANFDLFSLNSEVILNIPNIFFDFDKATLKKESFTELGKLIGVLRDDPDLHLEIRGHTDNHGTDEYNIRLSQSRAESVRSYLIAHGIAERRILAHGYGAALPIDDNATDAGRARNRRVEARLFKE